MSLKVRYVEDSKYPPYINHENAMIVLDVNEKLYTTDHDGNMYPISWLKNVDLTWDLNKHMKGYEINELLDEIKPLCEKLYKLHTIEYDDNSNRYGVLNEEANELYDTISEIVESYNDNDDNLISPWSASDWYINGESPAFIYNDIKNNGSLSDNVLIITDADDAYDEAINQIIYDLEDKIDNEDFIQTYLTNLFEHYKMDGYGKEFWLNMKEFFVPAFDEYLSLNGHEVYYKDERIL